MINSKRVLLVGGGSGGHVFPLVSVYDALKEIDSSIEFLMIGDGDFIDSAAKSRNIPFKKIKAAKARRYFSILNILDIWKVPFGFFQSLWAIFWFMPNVVFSKGGYSSLMPILISKLFFIPVIIHDSDAIPGSANRLLAKFSNRVLVGFELAKQYFKSDKVAFVGNPIRKDIANGERSKATQKFNLSDNRKTILVIGGSQGAKVINEAMVQASPLLVENWQVIHQTGQTQFDSVSKGLSQIIEEGKSTYGERINSYYKILPFISDEDISLAYALADIVICRAGASLISEASYLGKPAIVIPLANSANGHQLANAREIGKYGAVIIEEENLSRNILVNQIDELLNEDYDSVSILIKKFAIPDSNIRIAQEINNFLK